MSNKAIEFIDALVDFMIENHDDVVAEFEDAAEMTADELLRCVYEAN